MSARKVNLAEFAVMYARGDSMKSMMAHFGVASVTPLKDARCKLRLTARPRGNHSRSKKKV